MVRSRGLDRTHQSAVSLTQRQIPLQHSYFPLKPAALLLKRPVLRINNRARLLPARILLPVTGLLEHAAAGAGLLQHPGREHRAGLAHDPHDQEHPQQVHDPIPGGVDRSLALQHLRFPVPPLRHQSNPRPIPRITATLATDSSTSSTPTS